MNVLVLGGTRLIGPHLVRALCAEGHLVTLATRGHTADPFGAQVRRAVTDRYDAQALARTLSGRYDVIYDMLAFSSGDVRTALCSLRCDRYLMVSSASVYDPLRPNTPERDFSPSEHPLRWGGQADFSFDEGKRQAEAALFQNDWGCSAAAVRFPFVTGPDDYTGRLRFYASHIQTHSPMYVDNVDARMSFISSAEAGAFLAHLVSCPLTGPVNACSAGTISLRQLFQRAEARCGSSPVLSPGGDPAPYNGAEDYSLSTDKVARSGFRFSSVESWMPPLFDTFFPA